MDEKKLKAIFAMNLKRLRNERGLSQLAFATEANLAANFVNDIEQERKGVSIESIAKIAQALSVEPYELFLPIEALPSKTEKLISRYADELVKETEKAVRTVQKRFLNNKP